VGLTYNPGAYKNVHFCYHEPQKCCPCHYLLLPFFGLKISLNCKVTIFGLLGF
jgi:hypothetical protein